MYPIIVETVAGPAEIKNTLSLALLLPAMLAWPRFDEHRLWRDYFWALGCFVAALLSKSSVIMLPAVILLHAWWKRGRLGWTDAVPVVPFGAVSLASGITTVILQTKRAIGTEVFPVGGFLSRLALPGADLAFYLGKTLWPENLLPMYPRWRVDPPDIWQFLPWPLCAALLFGCWTRRRTWGRAALLSLGFFLLDFLPVLGFFQMSYWWLAWASDHLVYQPSLGIIGLAAVSAGTVYDCLRGRWRAAAVSAGWAAVAGLVFSTHRYAEAYMNLDTLCEYTPASNPDA